MYYVLSGALRRKIISELKMCFSQYFPAHKDVVENINSRFAFKSRPQKGIIVSISSSSGMKLSSDHMLGTVYSHVMLAKVEDKPGNSIEWIREDAIQVQKNHNRMLTPPGIYYIEIYSKEDLGKILTPQELNQVIQEEGDCPFYFYVDPLYSVKREPLTFKGTEVTSRVQNYPVTKDSIRIYMDRQQLLSGYALKITSPQTFEIKTPHKDSRIDLGLRSGTYLPKVKSVEGPFLIPPQGLLEMEINGTFVSVNVNPNPVIKEGQVDPVSTEQVAAYIRNALYGTIPLTDYQVWTEDNCVIISATESLVMEENQILGFRQGTVPAIAQGYVMHPYAMREGTLYIEIGGQGFNVPIYQGHNEPHKLAEHIQRQINMQGFEVEAVEAGDFSFDPETGEVTLYRPIEQDTKITASYNYPSSSTGPFGIQYNTSNNKAIPGVVLAFGRRLSSGDKMAVVVHDSRIGVADEYGGKWNMNVDLSLITRDPMTREEISDLIMMYFWVLRKEPLTDEGIEILDISMGGEDEEIYDSTGEDYYFNTSISMTMQTDWSVHVPKPLTLENVSQVSYYNEASHAGTDEFPENDLIKAYTPQELDLLGMSNIYLTGRNRDFEKIK